MTTLMVEKMITDVLKREGGYVNNPADRGGPTKFGITHKTLAAFLGRQVTLEEVQNLDERIARDIYRTRYYDAPKIGMLPEPWRELVFDWGVNSGPATAVRELQQLCQTHGHDPGPIDGVIGPKTAAAAAQLLTVPRHWYLERRRDFYERRVAERPDQAVFLAGWLNRIDELAAMMKSGEMQEETA